MLERGYIARQIRDIDAYVPEIARMLCSGDKEQIYKAKKLGDKFFTVIVEPHQLRNPWKWTIEIITRAYESQKSDTKVDPKIVVVDQQQETKAEEITIVE